MVKIPSPSQDTYELVLYAEELIDMFSDRQIQEIKLWALDICKYMTNKGQPTIVKMELSPNPQGLK